MSQACPLAVDLSGFIRYIREGNAVAALRKINEENPLPSVCGRICPAPCEKMCDPDGRGPLGIRALERYAADYGKEKLVFARRKTPRGKKIAIIGSGPMGLSAAAILAQRDYQVALFEAMDQAGGMLRYGLPEFRLTEGLVDEELSALSMAGVEITTNALFRNRENVKKLFKEGFAAILLALGGGRPVIPDIPGINYGGVYFATEVLMRVNHFKSERVLRDPYVTRLGAKVAVIGSNHAALDCARIAVRLGREASVIFPHMEEDIKATAQEITQAKEEGVRIEALTKPLEIVSDEKKFVKGLRCIHMDFADPQGNEQWQLMPVAESEFTAAADTVIISLGQQRNHMIEELVGLEGVFIPPQLTASENSVLEAIVAGKKMAIQMDEYLKK